MSAAILRWASPIVAAAWFELRKLAPHLAVLVQCPVPEEELHTVLDWIDEIVQPDPGPALSLSRLNEVLPALGVCFLCAHAYAVRPASGDHREALELYDPGGCGRVVGRALTIVSCLAKALHGEEGDRLVKTVQVDLVSQLEQIWDRIEAK